MRTRSWRPGTLLRPWWRAGHTIRTIRAITMEAVSWPKSGVVKLSRRESADHILRFSRAALGVT